MKTHRVEFSFSQTVKDTVVEFFRPFVQISDFLSRGPRPHVDIEKQVSIVLQEVEEGRRKNQELANDLLEKLSQLSSRVESIEQQNLKFSRHTDQQWGVIKAQLSSLDRKISRLSNRVSSLQPSEERRKFTFKENAEVMQKIAHKQGELAAAIGPVIVKVLEPSGSYQVKGGGGAELARPRPRVAEAGGGYKAVKIALPEKRKRLPIYK